ncbi:hypothetical protein JEP17_06905 [Proteus mirabilis]|nr:hypothetical protein [Proteus mirabilis]
MNVLTIKNFFEKKYSTFLLFPIEATVNILSSFFSFYILIYIITIPMTDSLERSDILSVIFLIVILRPFLNMINNISLYKLTKKQAYILSMFSDCFSIKKDIQHNEHDVINYSEYDASIILIASKIICFIYLSIFMVININEGLISLLSLCIVLTPLSFFLFKKRTYLSKKLAKARKLRYRFIGNHLELLKSIFLTGYKGGKISNLNRIFYLEEKIKRNDSLWRAIDISSNAFIKVIPVLFISLIGMNVDNSDTFLILLYSLILVSEYLGLIRLLTPFFDGYLAKNSIIKRYKNNHIKSETNYDLDGTQGIVNNTILGNIYLCNELLNRKIFNKLSYEIFNVNNYINMKSGINDLSRGQLSFIFAIRNIYIAIMNKYKGSIYFDVAKTGWDNNLLADMKNIIKKINEEYQINVSLSKTYSNKNIKTDNKKRKINFTNTYEKENKSKTNTSRFNKLINILSYNSFIGIMLLLVSSFSLFELGKITYERYDNNIANIILVSILGMASFIFGSFLIEFKIRKKSRHDIYNSIKNNFEQEGFNLFKHEYNIIINKFTMYAKDVFWFGAIFVGTMILSFSSESFLIIFFAVSIFFISIILLYPIYKKNKTKQYETLHILSTLFSYTKRLPQCSSVNKFCTNFIISGIHDLYDTLSKRYLITSFASILGLIISSLIIFYSLYPSFEPDNMTAAINLDNRIVIFYFAIFGYLSETVSIQRINKHNHVYDRKMPHIYNLLKLEEKLKKERAIQLVGNNGSGKTFFLRNLAFINKYIYIDHNISHHLINDEFLDYLNKSDSNVIIFDEFDCRSLIDKIDINKKIILVLHLDCLNSKLDISEII